MTDLRKGGRQHIIIGIRCFYLIKNHSISAYTGKYLILYKYQDIIPLYTEQGGVSEMASIESIFSTETKVQVLRVLSLNNRAYSVEDIVSETTKNKSAVYNAVRSLQKENIIKTLKTEGKTKYYKNNTEKPLTTHIETLFQEERNRELGPRNLPAKVINTVLNTRLKLINNIKGLDKVILFGSTARDQYTPTSDIDLYIVVENKDKETEDAIYDIIHSYSHDFSTIIKSKEEYKKEFEKPPSELAKSIITQGKVILYGKIDEDFTEYIEQGEN